MKTTIKTCIIALLLVNFFFYSVYADIKDIAILVNGINLDASTKPIMVQNTLFVPARELFKALDVGVDWSQELKEITAVKKDCNIIIKAGSKTALVNNKLYNMPQAAFLQNGIMMIPILFAGQALNMDVYWEAEKNHLIINMEDNDINFATYKDTIVQGIKKSADYNSAIIDYGKAHESNEEVFLTLGSYNLSMLQIKQDLMMYDRWTEMQIAITAERVGLSIRNLMDEISLLKVEKNLLEDKQDFINYKTRMDKLKYDNGLISLIEYNNAETEYELVNQNLEVINNKIDLSFINFNSVLERTQDTQVDLEYNIEFKPVGEVDLDDKIIHSIEEDPYIWFCKENLETKNFKLITYEYNVPEGKSYSLTGLDVSEARKDLLYTEKELDRVIRERYNNLLLLEDQIKILELNHKKAKRTVNIIRLQYDSGMTTRTQLEDSQLKVSELEFKIQELKQQHTQLKILFEKPYLAPEYFGGRNKAIEI